MKTSHKVSLIFLIVCIGVQFYRPDKNVQAEITTSDFLVHEQAPEDIINLYTNACYDCHSNHTDYDWFDNIAPVSWLVDNNIKKGVFSLNFSDWKNFSIIQKEIMFAAIPFNIDTDRMPKQDYVMFHSKAELSENDKVKMINWLNEVKAKFLLEELE